MKIKRGLIVIFGIFLLSIFSCMSFVFAAHTLDILVDSTAPQVNLSSPTSSAAYSGSTYNVPFIFNATDSESGVANCSVYVDNSPTLNTSSINATNNEIDVLISAGSHSAYINCTDISGNTGNSSTITFTITAPSNNNNDGGGGGGGGGGGTPKTSFWQVTRDITTLDLSQGSEQSLAYRERLKINLSINGKNKTYFTGISKLENNYVIVNVSGDSEQSAKFYSGNQEKFDLDSDNYYDLEIKINSIVNNKASLFIKQINEKINSAAAVTNPTNTANAIKVPDANTTLQQNENAENNGSASQTVYWVIVGGIILIILIIGWVIIYFIFKKRKNVYKDFKM
jgi:hypothetical protein